MGMRRVSRNSTLYTGNGFRVVLASGGGIEVKRKISCKMFLFRFTGNCHTYRGESQFSTWLHRLALNVVLMQMRKKFVRTSSLEQIAAEDRAAGRPETQYGREDHRLQFSLSRIVWSVP